MHENLNQNETMKKNHVNTRFKKKVILALLLLVMLAIHLAFIYFWYIPKWEIYFGQFYSVEEVEKVVFALQKLTSSLLIYPIFLFCLVVINIVQSRNQGD